ncbi:M4 family metallopeptidase [Cystobacter ferrugineus]|uniref:Peptidase M4 n=1 Tax=Cystobacter ferrugineus TaxID=83449 RepID=A0A1L9ATR6_9BACT|nr:M4 family metallopeptidase [Cystobacter ferrugineus]OJH33374.1 peptidase M4 [Cystobacter ferrugineus]
MRNRLLATCLSLSLAACGGTEAPTTTKDAHSALAALPSAEIIGTHEDGVPFMIRGELGSVGGSVRGLAAREVHERVSSTLAAVAPVFHLRAEDLVVQRASRDEQGHTHIRYAQVRNGLPVFGHELILHVDTSGRVYAANGSARDGESVPNPEEARVSPEAIQRAALDSTPGGVRVEGEPRLLYARSTRDQRLKLAYEVLVTGEHLGTPVQEHVFLDALDGTPVLRDSDIQNARSRRVYSANNGTSLPGTLKRAEGAPPTSDVVVDKTYDNLGITYDCYNVLFNRQSYDGADGQLRATVHYGTNYTNAFWDGSQLVCGDGDGVTTGSLCMDMDIITHEFTHGLISTTSNLTSSGEPGGLNESLSNILAAVCESWTTGTWSTGADIWKIGEDTSLGGTVYSMADPAAHGALDYYTPLPSDVHDLAGISDLAFTLLSKGGKHPRGKSTLTVTGIGVEKAGHLFYKANTDYFTASTTLAQAKTYTELAADALYGTGSGMRTSVTQAWQAVGVGVVPAPCPPLANGTALTGLSGASGSVSCTYSISVPVGATHLKVEASGGTGDVDLYVKFGSAPTTSSFDCRPYLGGNTESCTFPTPSAGIYYIILRSFSAYSGVSLKASFTPPVGAYVFPNLSGTSISEQFFTYNAAAGQAVTVTVSPGAGGSTGDVDLYVKFGSAPTSTAYDCRPYLSGNSERCTLSQSQAGTYYVMLKGYSAYTGVDLTISVP